MMAVRQDAMVYGAPYQTGVMGSVHRAGAGSARSGGMQPPVSYGAWHLLGYRTRVVAAGFLAFTTI